MKNVAVVLAGGTGSRVGGQIPKQFLPLSGRAVIEYSVSLSQHLDNDTERAVRIIKVKQKVSGCFRTVLGADNYARLHSIMDTAHKNGQSKYHALLALAMT